MNRISNLIWYCLILLPTIATARVEEKIQLARPMNQPGGRTAPIISQDFFVGISSLSGEEVGFAYEIDLTKYQKVVREFGPTVIDVTTLPYSSPVLDSGKRPWSSWWFQKIRHDFTGDPGSSILAKFDRAYRIEATENSTYAAEKKLERRQFSAWEGLCDAWALSSLFYPEPRRAVTVGGVNFTVGDLKGLILKSYEAVPDSDLTTYGEKFLGNADSWMFPDLFPEQFHRFIEIVLGRNKQVFVMDRDPGAEVWNVPVYKSNYRIEKHPNDPRKVIVKMWLFAAGARSFERRDEVGRDEIVYEYVYELNGELSADQKLLTVNSGSWSQSGFTDSRVNHPDYLLLPKSNTLNRASYNPNLDSARVDRIVKGSL
jgi:hypothetical protein